MKNISSHNKRLLSSKLASEHFEIFASSQPTRSDDGDTFCQHAQELGSSPDLVRHQNSAVTHVVRYYPSQLLHQLFVLKKRSRAITKDALAISKDVYQQVYLRTVVPGEHNCVLQLTSTRLCNIARRRGVLELKREMLLPMIHKKKMC